MRAYASNMFQFGAEATAERAKRAQDAGFTAVKFGWDPMGRSADRLRVPRGDREGLGDELDLMIDAGLFYDAKTAIQRARLFEPFRPVWFEEPLLPDDYAGYAKLAAATDGSPPARRRARRGLYPTHGRRPDRRRAGRPDPLRPHRGDEDRRAGRAARPAGRQPRLHDLHQRRRGAALPGERPNAFIMEYCVEPSEISRALAKLPIPIVDGHATVPEEPGLGVEPDPAIIEKYLVRD